MVLIREYRIPLPITVEEYRIAQLYMVAKVSKNHTSNGEGVEILDNKPYADGALSGQYTHKVFHLGSRLPTWLRSFTPTSLQIEEKSWNAYPYCKTIYQCPLLGERFSISIETRYAQDSGDQHNCLNLHAEDLVQREIDFIDIAHDPIDDARYKVEEDPKIFQSIKTGRGKLHHKDWHKKTDPIMCSYKVCKVEFKMWGIQNKVENYIQKSVIRDILFMGHRQVFSWMDEWYGLDMYGVREFEKRTKDELNSIIHQNNNSNNGSLKTSSSNIITKPNSDI